MPYLLRRVQRQLSLLLQSRGLQLQHMHLRMRGALRLLYQFLNHHRGKIIAGPDIHARGFAEDEALFDEVKLKIEKALARAVSEGINGTHQLSQIVRKTIGEWVGTTHRRRPMIVPVVIEV